MSNPFIHQDNVIMHRGKAIRAFEHIPVRLLRTYKDRRRKWKSGSLSAHVEHFPGATTWSLCVDYLLLDDEPVEGVDYEFLD